MTEIQIYHQLSVQCHLNSRSESLMGSLRLSGFITSDFTAIGIEENQPG